MLTSERLLLQEDQQEVRHLQGVMEEGESFSGRSRLGSLILGDPNGISDRLQSMLRLLMKLLSKERLWMEGLLLMTSLSMTDCAKVSAVLSTTLIINIFYFLVLLLSQLDRRRQQSSSKLKNSLEG